jgi:polyketide cyclase/dehydrase/lipid transport protein
MRAFTFAAHIDRTPDAVWDFMMDRTNAPRWNNLVRKAAVITPGPVRVGSQILVTLDSRGRTLEITSEVWVVERPRRYGVRNTRNNVTGVFEYRLRPDGTGTHVRFQCDIHPHGSMWLALPLLVRDSRRRYRDQLGNLKRIVEAGS